MGGERGDREGRFAVSADLLVVALDEQVVADVEDVRVPAVARQGDDRSDGLVGLGEFQGVDRTGGVPEGAESGRIDEIEGLEVGQAVRRARHDLRIDAVLSGVSVAELVDAEDDEASAREFDRPECRGGLLVGLIAVKREKAGRGVLGRHPRRAVDLRDHRLIRIGHELDSCDLDPAESGVGGFRDEAAAQGEDRQEDEREPQGSSGGRGAGGAVVGRRHRHGASPVGHARPEALRQSRVRVGIM